MISSLDWSLIHWMNWIHGLQVMYIVWRRREHGLAVSLFRIQTLSTVHQQSANRTFKSHLSFSSAILLLQQYDKALQQCYVCCSFGCPDTSHEYSWGFHELWLPTNAVRADVFNWASSIWPASLNLKQSEIGHRYQYITTLLDAPIAMHFTVLQHALWSRRSWLIGIWGCSFVTLEQ